jgi:hypothetical protein
MALVACYLACFRDWRKYLSPGERAIVLLVAADREQAKILHRYCQGILSPPLLSIVGWKVCAHLARGVTLLRWCFHTATSCIRIGTLLMHAGRMRC